MAANVDINHPPAGGFQNGAWYWDPTAGQARQYFNGSFGAPNTIANPSQQGYGQQVSQGGVQSPSSTPSTLSPADQFLHDTIDTLTKPLNDAIAQGKKFDQNNPFSFDEALATQSADERLDPYYKAQLSDYLTGINRTRNRSTQDEQQLRSELDTSTDQTTGRLQRNLADTIQNTTNAYDANGLASSGAALRDVGKTAVGGAEDLNTTIRQYGLQKQQSLNRQSRTLEDLGTAQNTFQRNQNADQATAVQTDVQQQKQEQEQQYNMERAQAYGPLLGGTSTSSLLSTLGLG